MGLIVTPKRMKNTSVNGLRSGIVNGVRPSGILWPDMENLLAWRSLKLGFTVGNALFLTFFLKLSQ